MVDDKYPQLQARISPPADYMRVSTPRWGSLPARPTVSLLNAIRDRENGQEQHQQPLASTKSPGKKKSFINRSFRKLRMKIKPKPRPDASIEAVTIAAEQVRMDVVFFI